MENDISNIILEERIKNSLFKKAPDGFTDKLFKEIRLSEEFAREDKKTTKTLKYLLGVLGLFIISFGTILFSAIIGKYEAVRTEEENIITGLPDYINKAFSGILEIFGFSISNLGIIYLLIILIIILGFTFSDKFIVKKSL
jgi:hypothetical protein